MSDARAYWYKLYRKMRIARRECRKAAIDSMMYGTGAVTVDKDGVTRHIPIAEVLIKNV